MDRRSFVQNLGATVAVSALSNAPSSADTSGSAAPGKILAIAAHPGDGLFTMGATVAQQIARGGTGAFLSLSLGERGAPKNIPVQQYGDMQRVATEKAAHLLGANALFLLYPDAEIPFNEESSLRVSDIIREQKPEIVVTHWSGSWHKDHQNCHRIVRDAIFYAGLQVCKRSSANNLHMLCRKFFMQTTGRTPPTSFLTPTLISKVCMKSGCRRAISIRCGGARRDSFATTIITAAWL